MRFTNRQILKIAGPILVSVLMEHLIGMTDTAFLGRVGEVELGASAWQEFIIWPFSCWVSVSVQGYRL